MISTDIGMWVAAFFLVATWSYVFKETVLFRTAEHAFLGISAGHLFIMGLNSIRTYAYVPITRGNYFSVLPILLGFLVYAAASKKYYWLSRFPMSLLIGVASGLAIRGLLSAQVVQQVTDTVAAARIVPSLNTNINNLVTIVMVICVLSYFFFSINVNREPLKTMTRIGRYSMMIAFGATAGGEIFARGAMMVNRLIFLLGELLGLI